MDCGSAGVIACVLGVRRGLDGASSSCSPFPSLPPLPPSSSLMIRTVSAASLSLFAFRFPLIDDRSEAGVSGDEYCVLASRAKYTVAEGMVGRGEE